MKHPKSDPALEDEFKKIPRSGGSRQPEKRKSASAVDGASSHISKGLEIPKNVSFIRLPPYSPFWSIVKIRLTGKRNFVSKTSGNCFLRL